VDDRNHVAIAALIGDTVPLPTLVASERHLAEHARIGAASQNPLFSSMGSSCRLYFPTGRTVPPPGYFR
jgi:hypothetical protein